MDRGARIFQLGGPRATPNYGPVGAAKTTLEAHIRQLAVEPAPALPETPRFLDLEDV